MLLVLERLVQFNDVGMVQLPHNPDLVQDYGRVAHVLLADGLHDPQIMRKDLQPGEVDLAIGALSHFLTPLTRTLMMS